MRGLSDLNRGGGAGGSAAGGGGGCADCIKNSWANTPFWTRSLFIMCTVVYGLSWLTTAVLQYTVCIPQLVIPGLQVWRLFTGHFMHPQLMTYAFAMLSHLPHASTAEKSIGTVRYFFRFWMLGTATLLSFSLVCGVTGIQDYSIGLWPMLFCDLVVECMQTPEQVTGLCCLPVQIKRKWYPLILIAIFSILMFSASMWFGLGVGYLYHYGFFKRIEIGSNKATQFENKWPFKIYKERPFFIQAGAAMGGTILPSFGNAAAPAREQAAASNDSGSAPASSSNSANANFKAFAGKGTSIGGAPISAAPASAPPQPTISQQARSASGSASSSSSASGQRTGSALIAKLEEKKKKAKQSSDLTTTETEIGHDMDPDDSEPVRASDDKSDDAIYGKISETDNSV